MKGHITPLSLPLEKRERKQALGEWKERKKDREIPVMSDSTLERGEREERVREGETEEMSREGGGGGEKGGGGGEEIEIGSEMSTSLWHTRG